MPVIPKSSGHQKLISWYQKNKRNLLWRKTKDPYLIWISEIMLQQTGVQVVTDYFRRFIKRFPDLKSLKTASFSEVLKYWSGLGYYHRAKSLHQTSKILFQKKSFPKSYKELKKLPGIGEYSSRAISSLCFKEKVGVVDGNVIRVLCRKHGLKIKWWDTNSKKLLQNLSDDYAIKSKRSDLMNSSLMELGAMICLPTKPYCHLCPWLSQCSARKNKTTHLLPLKRKKQKPKMYLWKINLSEKAHQIALTKNKNIPFLKSYFHFPGALKQIQKRPNKYHFSHRITSYLIYVLVLKKTKPKNVFWVSRSKLSSKLPSSLVKKVLSTQIKKT